MKRLLVLAPFLAAAIAACTTGSTSKKDTASVTNTPTATPCAGGDGVLCTVAGQEGLSGNDGDGGAAGASRLYWPQDVFCAPDNSIYILDWNNHAIRKVDASGTISLLVGGEEGDTCAAAGPSIRLNHPTDVRLGPDGLLYMAAWHNHKIKRTDPVTGYTTCWAGVGTGFAGDNGPAATAQFSYPTSLDFDSAGNLYVNDSGNQRIRRIDTQATPIITTIAGSSLGYNDACGASAQFFFPFGQNAPPVGKLCVDRIANALYVADSGNHRIRRVDLATGCVTTAAGSGAAGFSGDGGPAISASLNTPMDVAIGPDGSLYIADSGNHRIRRVLTNGAIQTVAGTGVASGSPDGTLAASANLHTPCGVFVATDNTLYIADTYNHQVKRVRNP